VVIATAACSDGCSASEHDIAINLGKKSAIDFAKPVHCCLQNSSQDDVGQNGASRRSASIFLVC
jgi:hypothetical protein